MGNKDYKEFFDALDILEREKKISRDKLIEALEAGILFAYKKETGETRQITVRADEDRGTIRIFAYRQIVETVEDPDKEISLEEAREYKDNYKVGDIVLEDITPRAFSRIAAQTAKQVIMQRLNDARRDIVMSEMTQREGEILSAIVRKKEGSNIFVEISGNQMEGVLSLPDQVPGERLEINDVVKVFVKKVRTTNYGAQVVVSRAAAGFVKRLFELEVPEIRSGLVKVNSIVREAGYRTKIAVSSDDSSVDAIGSCIGPKGSRVNAIVAELNGEKIDVIAYCADPLEYVARALSPAPVQMVQINEEEKSARVVVSDEKLSLAIGKQGQNARLAAKLTGWRIDVKPYSAVMKEFAPLSEETEAALFDEDLLDKSETVRKEENDA